MINRFLVLLGVTISLLFGQSILASAETVSFPSKSTYSGQMITLTGELKKSTKSGKRPTVILLHGCGGLQPIILSSLRSHARSLLSAGYTTLILDSFKPRGIAYEWVCKRVSRLASAQAYRQRDVKDAITYLKTLDHVNADRVFVMGQSNGGSVASLIAHRPIKGVKAAVAFYPWCGAVPRSPKIPLLVLSGEADNWTPPEQCKKQVRPGSKLRVITFPGAVHSFDVNIPVQNYLGFKVGRNPKAKARAKREMINFLKEYTG